MQEETIIYRSDKFFFIIAFSIFLYYNKTTNQKGLKMLKKVLSLFLSFIIILSFASTAFAAESAKLYNFYGDGMLFRQNEKAILAGTASAGGRITATLLDAAESVIAMSETKADSDGTFEISFNAPAGGFDEYTIVLSFNGTEFETLENVVFGELWLASGQSNMQYPLGQDKTGLEMYNKKQPLGDWLRVLCVPAIPEYKGSTALVPAEPQNDITGACWVTGNDEAIYGMSAVAYFFAKEMTEELNMPVGILNVPLGGSVIASWISREAIDSDSEVKNILTSAGQYFDKDSWNEAERSIFYDMTCNYNLKIEPLRHFRLSGMIWYQGESDIMFGKTPAQYASLFDLMQRSYTEVFDYRNGLLPVVYTQLAAYQYHTENGTDLLDMNIVFSQMQKAEKDSRAVVSIYDVPLTYLQVAGAIHPECKKEIGERMADSAMGLVYGASHDYTAATVESYEIKDGKIYVTLENTGDGLVADGMLTGFAVAGEDGIFVQAKAEITGSDTIVIYNENITEPVSASYAYALGNIHANLYSGRLGKKALPVSPFVVNKPENSTSWFEKQWADCETETVFHLKDDAYTKEYAAWTGKNAEVTVETDSAFSGEKGLHVTATEDSFSVMPSIALDNKLSSVRFNDEDSNYGKYGSVIFNVRNNSAKDVVFDSLKLHNGAVAWYSPSDEAIVIPADGEWHRIEVDINNLLLYGIDFGMKFSNDKLDNISGIEFCFTGEKADISIDEISFTPEKDTHDSSVDIMKLVNIIEIIRTFILTLLSAITA